MYKLQLFLSIKHHVMKTRGEVRLHTLSRSGLHGGEWSASPRLLSPGERTRTGGWAGS